MSDKGLAGIAIGFLALIIALGGIVYPESETESGARAYRNVAQSIPPLSWIDVQWDTENFDLQDEMNLTTYRFTVKESGFYLLLTGIKWSANSQGVRIVTIRLNDTIDVSTGKETAVYSGYGVTITQCSTVLSLDADDYLDVRVYQNTGTSINIGGDQDTFFSAFKLG